MPKSVLVVDDAAFMRRMLRDVLTAAGYRVLEAVSGRDALEKYVEDRPDLVTMDVGMPDMSGLDVIERIRAEDQHALIIVVSAAGSDDVVERALALGAAAFVRKPFQPATVVDTVRKTLLVPPASRC